MAKVGVFIIDNFEELEAISSVDILRRGQVDVTIVSLSNEIVKSKHNVNIKADAIFEPNKDYGFDMIVIPGGTTDYIENNSFVEYLKVQSKKDVRICAICAAPTVLGRIGLLKGKKAVCYKGMEKDLIGAQYVNENVVIDGNIITSRGPSTAIEFGFAILKQLKGNETVNKIKADMLFD